LWPPRSCFSPRPLRGVRFPVPFESDPRTPGIGEAGHVRGSLSGNRSCRQRHEETMKLLFRSRSRGRGISRCSAHPLRARQVPTWLWTKAIVFRGLGVRAVRGLCRSVRFWDGPSRHRTVIGLPNDDGRLTISRARNRDSRGARADQDHGLSREPTLDSLPRFRKNPFFSVASVPERIQHGVTEVTRDLRV
jgi:hypothetical protein